MINLNQLTSSHIYHELPFGILVINKEKIIVSHNKAVAKTLNVPTIKINGQAYTRFLPHSPSIESFFQKNTAIIDVINFEYNYNYYTFTTIGCDKQGNILGILLQDNNMIEQASSDFNNLSLKKILDSSLDEIFITDGEGNISFINAAAEAFYGEIPEKLVGKNVSQLEEEGYFSPALFPIAKKRGEKVSMIQRTKMGKTIHSIAYPSFNEEGELTNIIFNARDITEIRYLRDKIERSEVLIETYKTELQELQNFQSDTSEFIAFAPAMRKIKQTVEKVAPFNTTILITGESGVGKGVIAHQIHEQSKRKDQALVHINCGAIPESLIESELFGYDRGAFTGAKTDGQKGVIEQADNGTLFLDEIGEMPLHLQVKLLKVLQDQTFRRVGGNKDIKVDIRIIAATNQDLQKRVEDNLFREDLFYRLNVVPIHIPPLRKRPEDITYMIDFYIAEFNKKYDQAKRFTLEAENILLRYNWPGNVRELENLIERLVVTTESDEINASDLPSNILFLNDDEYAINVNDIVPLKLAQEQMEEQLIRKAYDVHTSSYKVASMLGINQSTAHRKINQYIKSK